MSHKNLQPLTIFTCDRCQDEVLMNTGKYPITWAKVTKHASYGYGEINYDLCSECLTKFYDLFIFKVKKS